MKKHIYYHLYLPNEHAAWSNYLLEQFKTCEDHGLIDEIDTFNLVLVGKPKNIELATRLAETLSNKIDIHTFENNFEDDSELNTLDSDLHGVKKRTMSEFGCLSILADHARDDDAYFLYMHAKGVTSYERCLRQKKFEVFKNYLYWRKFLEWGTIENWKTCVEKLDEGYDVVGCNYTTWPMKHFSGNYWWSKSSYIKSINHINNDDWWNAERESRLEIRQNTWRLRDEMWICHGENAKLFSLKDAENPPPKSNLASDFYPRKKYASN